MCAEAYGVYYDYVPQDLLIANFTNSAGLATNPIGPQAVVSLGNNYDPTAFNGSNPGAPIFTAPAPPFPSAGRGYFLHASQSGDAVCAELEFQCSAGFDAMASPSSWAMWEAKGRKLVRLRDANQPDINGNRPNPNYGFMDEFGTISASTYHALQATLRTPDWHGLSGFTGYTWSKSLDDASDGIDFNFATVALPQDSNNLRAEHGPSNFDTRQRFTAAFTYSLPQLRRTQAADAGMAAEYHRHCAERAAGSDR